MILILYMCVHYRSITIWIQAEIIDDEWATYNCEKTWGGQSKSIDKGKPCLYFETRGKFRMEISNQMV